MVVLSIIFCMYPKTFTFVPASIKNTNVSNKEITALCQNFIFKNQFHFNLNKKITKTNAPPHKTVGNTLSVKKLFKRSLFTPPIFDKSVNITESKPVFP